MHHSSAYLSLCGKVADEGGGKFVGEQGAGGVAQQITANIRLSRCDEIDALPHKRAVTVGLNRRSELPRSATGIGHTAYNSLARTSAQRTYNNDYQPITPHNPMLTKRGQLIGAVNPNKVRLYFSVKSLKKYV